MKTLRCQRCRAVNDLGSRRCERCGASFTSSPAKKKPSGRLDADKARAERARELLRAETAEFGLPPDLLRAAAPPMLGGEVGPEPRPPSGRRRRPPSGRRPAPRLYLHSPLLDKAIPVSPGGAVTIGRSPDCTLFFPVKAVSRRHCEIRWESGRCKLIDLGSTNGTYIGGHKVEVAVIDDGDRIRIGPFEVFVYKKKPERPSQLVPADLVRSDTPFLDTPPWTFSADLAHISVPEVIQVLELNERTGRLIFEMPGRDRGALTFETGRICHAEFQGMIPRDAVLELLDARRGWVVFLSLDAIKGEKTIAQSNQSILLEAARRSDEEALLRDRGDAGRP